jgi:hypothetical protein
MFELAFTSKFRGLRSAEKRTVLLGLWPRSATDSHVLDESHDNYLDFFRSEVAQVQHHRAAFAAQDLNSIFTIVEKLRENHDKPCREIVHILSTHFLNFDSAAIRRSLELSTRLWLMLNTRSSEISFGPIFAGAVAIEWDLDCSLDALVQKQFARRTHGHVSKEYSNIDPEFSAAYLINTCGLKLEWTDDISEHLDFDSRRTILRVYRHKICVVHHLNNGQGCPLPEDLLGEILDTLNLLFPFGDGDTRQLLRREGQASMYSLGSCNRSRQLNLAQYQYFGEALEHLMESFDKAPRTWRQLAFDRRNKLEWSAFWVTIMVAFLTVVSIPCNIIQATYSVKAYHAAVVQGSIAASK